MATSSVTSQQITTESTSYAQAFLPSQDPNLIYRIVGFYEYNTALKFLDRLILTSTVDELDAADAIVRSENEFIIYTNLSRRVDGAPSTLTEKKQAEGDTFARHGLRWVTALARVEVGAMLAGYTNHPSPFDLVNITSFDADECKELLLDGARIHFWSLFHDKDFQDIQKVYPPTGATLVYVRRLKIARLFTETASRIEPQRFTPEQAVELTAQVATLDKTGTGLVGMIALHLSTVYSQKNKNTQESQTLTSCLDGVCHQWTSQK